MNTKVMQYILTVAEEKSVSAAARKLYISQSALSHRIIELEEELGVKLFDRSTVPLRLTYAGEVYVDIASNIIYLERELETRMGELTNNRTGRIVLGISLFRNSTIMPFVMPLFTSKYPDVRIELVEATNRRVMEMISSGKVDLAFVTERTNDKLEYFKLLQDRILLAVGRNHPCSRGYRFTSDYPELDLSLLNNETFVMLQPGSKLHDVSMEIFKDCGFSPKTVIETANVEFANRMAAAGAAVAFVLESVKTLYHEDQQPNYFRFRGREYNVNLYLCYRKDFPLPRYMVDFIHIIQQNIKSNHLTYPHG